MPDDEHSDKRLELAYNAAQQKLTLQDSTLSSTRTRASGLLATAALFISFSAGVGLINLDPAKGPVFQPYTALVMLVIIVALGGCVLFILWPAKKWCYVPSAEKILEKTDADETESAIRRFVTEAMITGAKDNQALLKPRQTAFRWAVGLLVGEVVLLLSTLAAV